MKTTADNPRQFIIVPAKICNHMAHNFTMRRCLHQTSLIKDIRVYERLFPSNTWHLVSNDSQKFLNIFLGEATLQVCKPEPLYARPERFPPKNPKPGIML